MHPDTALIVLDLQRDFLEDTGRMPIARGQVAPLIAVANAMIDAAAADRAPVVYVVNQFPRSAFVLNFFRHGAAITGSSGAEVDPRVHATDGVRFAKSEGDAFSNPALDAFLRERGVRQLVLLGVFAPRCVRATARGALRRGYGVTVVRDGVAAASDRARDTALAEMETDGATSATSAALLRQ